MDSTTRRKVDIALRAMDVWREELIVGTPSGERSLMAAGKTLAAEVRALRQDVIAFCGPWAATYARDLGLPSGHLHPTHYDILERAGARMDDFTRASVAQEPA